MFRIIIRYIYVNRRNSILTIALFVMIFYLTGLMLDEQKKNLIERNYVNEWEDSWYFYQNSFLMKGDNQNIHFGYYRSATIQNDATSRYNACWEVNEYYANWFIKNVRGRSLDFHNGRKEVLLYGSDLEQENRIGQEISLGGVAYTIVGIIPFDQPLFSLQFSPGNGFDTDYFEGQRFDETVELLEKFLCYPYNGNMYIVNDGLGCEKANWTMYGMVSANDENSPLHNQEAISIKRLKQIVLEGIGFRSRFSVFSIVLLIGLNLFVLLSMSMIQYQQCHANLGVYCLCGMGQIAYDFLCSLIWMVNILAAYFIDYIIVNLTSGGIYGMSIYKAGFIGIMAGSSMLLICLWNFISYRKAVLEVLKRNELSGSEESE